MSEIKLPIRCDGGFILDDDDNIIAAYPVYQQQGKGLYLQMIEACNNYYKIKEALKTIDKARETLKSCES